MNFYINQTIQINYLRLESISNSSILQIGSAGSIKSLSNLYNTGIYVEPKTRSFWLRATAPAAGARHRFIGPAPASLPLII